MQKLEQALNKQVVVKLTGLPKAATCQLVGVDEAGIWVASKDLTDDIRTTFGQVVLPDGYPMVFVPFTRLDLLVLSTEKPIG